MGEYIISGILCFLSLLLWTNAITNRKACTFDGLLEVKNEPVQFMASMLSPLLMETFFTTYFEEKPIKISQRPQGFYEGLIDLNTIGDFLKSKQIDQSLQDIDKASTNSNFKYKIKHGGDSNFKLVKRVWRNGDWWTSTPNISAIPLEVVYASFERKGYSIVIDKIQEFHPPLKLGKFFLCICN